MNKKTRQRRIARVLQHAEPVNLSPSAKWPITPVPVALYHYSAYQQSPNTMVELWAADDYTTGRVLGFSKVNWPDEFDSAYGIELALTKAAAKLVKLHYDRPKYGVGDLKTMTQQPRAEPAIMELV